MIEIVALLALFTTASPERKLIATTKISEAKTSATLPTTFHGEVIVGRVAVQNDSDAPIKLSRIKTSCGCTKVRIEDKKILMPSDTLNLDFEIKQTRVGPYSVTLTVFNSSEAHEINLRGKNFRRIEVLEPKIKPSEDGLNFRLGVNDSTIDPNKIRVLGGEVTKVVNDLLFVRFEDTGQPFINVVPVVGKKEYASKVLRIERPKIVRLATQNIRRNKGKIRLLVLGQFNEPSVSLFDGDQTQDVELSVKAIPDALIIEAKINDLKLTNPSLQVNKTSLPFTLR